MIIFDLDTLADCEHRRHFVDPSKNPDYEYTNYVPPSMYNEFIHGPERMFLTPKWISKISGKLFFRDWKSFQEACDKDLPIEPTVIMWNDQIEMGMMGAHQIWSGRCESFRHKTEKWLSDNLLCFESHQLKMRPIGDNTPLHELKERWLNEFQKLPKMDVNIQGINNIDFVFDSDPESIRMWRKNGIFVFNSAQRDGEI